MKRFKNISGINQATNKVYVNPHTYNHAVTYTVHEFDTILGLLDKVRKREYSPTKANVSLLWLANAKSNFSYTDMLKIRKWFDIPYNEFKIICKEIAHDYNMKFTFDDIRKKVDLTSIEGLSVKEYASNHSGLKRFAIIPLMPPTEKLFGKLPNKHRNAWLLYIRTALIVSGAEYSVIENLRRENKIRPSTCVSVLKAISKNYHFETVSNKRYGKEILSKPAPSENKKVLDDMKDSLRAHAQLQYDHANERDTKDAWSTVLGWDDSDT